MLSLMFGVVAAVVVLNCNTAVEVTSVYFQHIDSYYYYIYAHSVELEIWNLSIVDRWVCQNYELNWATLMCWHMD